MQNHVYLILSLILQNIWPGVTKYFQLALHFFHTTDIKLKQMTMQSHQTTNQTNNLIYDWSHTDGVVKYLITCNKLLVTYF